MFVKPAEGRAVRDPLSRVLLSSDGEEKPDTRFWRRRVRDEDVIKAKRPADVEPEPEAKDVKPVDQAALLVPEAVPQAETPADSHVEER